MEELHNIPKTTHLAASGAKAKAETFLRSGLQFTHCYTTLPFTLAPSTEEETGWWLDQGI